jgi:hypothetical protein
LKTLYSYPISPGAVLAWSIMGPDNDPQNYWFDDTTYNTILASMVNPPPEDPATILVTGVLMETGDFAFGPSLNLPNGTVTTSIPGGDLDLSALDSDGNVVTSISMKSNFSAYFSIADQSTSAPSLLDIGAMSVLLEIPADASIDHLQLSQNGKALQITSMGGQLLSGIGKQIPDNAFRSSEWCHQDSRWSCGGQAILKDRKRLNDLISRIQSMLNKGKLYTDSSRQLIQLFNCLISEIKRITYENYSVADQSQLTRSEVIAQIQSVLKNLNLDKFCARKKEGF